MGRKAVSLLIVVFITMTMFSGTAFAEGEPGEVLYNLNYSVNGGEGTVPETISQYEGTTTIVADGDNLSNYGLVFWKWNTIPDGTGKDYFPDDEYIFIAETTLYALFREPVHVTGVTLNKKACRMLIGSTLALTAAVLPEDTSYPDITWTSSNNEVAAVDQEGNVTAESKGTAVITAAADSLSDTCTIIVVENEYTVKFNTQGGPELPDIAVLDGGTFSEPEQPVRDGYLFEGWYKEQTCINPWDFNADAVTCNTTLYAEWKMEGCAFSGSGTPENPYRITNAEDLAALSSLVNAGNTLYSDKCYIQTQDIDLSEYDSWEPIGLNNNKPFHGIYNGNKKKLLSLNINRHFESMNVYGGLFGYVLGTIENIYIENSRITVDGNGNYNVYVGVIAGYIKYSSIKDCTVRNVNAILTECTYGYLGGIIGYSESSMIFNCNTTGIIKGYGINPRVGGIIGRINEGSSIKECYNFGTITAEGSSSSFASGITAYIVATNSYCSIEKCFNSGEITSIGGRNSIGTCAAGISGNIRKANLIDCYNIGNINSQSQDQGSYSGGIVGQYDENGIISRCYNLGYISGNYQGGIAGRNYTSTNFISDCYYYDSCTAAVGTGTGTAFKMSAEELRLQSTFIGFDFDNVWTMDNSNETGYCYPQLKDNLLYTHGHELLLNADNEQGYTEGSGNYKFTETVTITARAQNHYVFKNWAVSSGGLVLNDPTSLTETFIMPDTDISIEAVFEKQKYTLTVQSVGNGTGSGGGSFAWSDGVTVKANADSGYQFMCWEVISGEALISDLTCATAVVTMPKSDAVIKAVFCVQPPNYTYKITDNKVAITGYTGTDSSIVLPDRLGGCSVNAINSSAFVGNRYIVHVVIPDAIEVIGDYAFSECAALTEIHIGKSVRDMGLMTFSNCLSLQDIMVSEENTHLLSEYGVVYNKAGTELICCPPGKSGIFKVPDSVEKIHEAAFDYCIYITDAEIPDSVVNIERFAFNHCTNLTDVDIPDSVTFIGESAFLDCIKLQSIKLPNMLSAISSYTFSRCNMLKSITIPDSVTTIGYASFSGCVSLESVKLSDNLESIGARAFNSCNLNSISFPVSLSDIRDEAFLNNRSLIEAYFMGGKPVFGTGVFTQASSRFKVYYHVSKKTEWAAYSAFSKQPFCFVTTDFNNEQPNKTNLVLLNDFKIPNIVTPKWEEHTFETWYKDEACTTAWDFTKDTTAGDITLYAKWKPGPYKISVVSSNTYYGSVSGGGEYELDKEVTLHAVPCDGCRFIRWTKDGSTVSYAADYKFSITAGGVYTAEFNEIGIPQITDIFFIGNNSLQIEWSEVTGAAGYQIYRSETSDGEYEAIDEVSSNSYTDSGLIMDTTYYYMVSAYCITGAVKTYGEQSEYVSQETVVPAPEIISADSTGYESTCITWNEVRGATGYEIFRSTTNSGSYALIYSTPQTSYINKKLKTGTTYYYKVRGYNDFGYTRIYSAFSDSAFCVPVPQKVAGVNASAHSTTSLKLTWSKTPGKSGYEVWRSISPVGGFSLIKTTSSTYCYDTKAKPNTPYFYMVRAYRNVGKKKIPGDFSDTISAKTSLGSVTEAAAKMYYPTNIKISWKSVKGCKGYEVERSEYPDKEFKVIKSTSSTYYKDTGLVTNTRYYYRVCAYVVVDNERVRTDYSTVVSDIPALAKVSGLKALVSSSTKIKISWNPVSGCSGYEILRSDTAEGTYETIYSTSRTYYYDSGLEPNKTYYYKVRAYRTFSGVRKYGEESEIASATPVLGSVSGAAATAYSSSKNKITWEAVSGRSGYEIYRSETANGIPVYIGTTTYTYYCDKNNVAGKTYYYCVRAYVIIGNSRFYTDYSNTAGVIRTP